MAKGKQREMTPLPDVKNSPQSVLVEDIMRRSYLFANLSAFYRCTFVALAP
jgi:hypothetical protein